MFEMVSKDSPLRRLPDGLELPQLIILDAIRYAADMVGLSYSRLLTALREFRRERPEPNTARPFTAAFTDTWCIVDATNRLRALVALLPVPKDAATMKIKQFLASTEVVRELRNSVQHITKRIDRLVAKSQPAWGSISWISIESPDRPKYFIHAVAAGTLYGGHEVPMTNPTEKRLRGHHVDGVWIMDITFHAHEKEVPLTYVVAEVEGLVRLLESSLAQQFTPAQAAGGDLYVSAEFSPGGTEPTAGTHDV